MSDSSGALLALLILLQTKHMFADYFLQTKIMLDGRETYVHFGRFLHAGIHAAGSVIAFLLVGAPIGFIIPVVLAEWVVHFHIDWMKGRYTAQQGLTPADAAFWRAAGVDQALHQLTYVLMIWVWLVYAAS
ncbi:MAG: DUF3307 domain-containing protein [Pseudomonadota bacterium]